MAAYHRVYDSRHLQADCQELGSAPKHYARYSSMDYISSRRRRSAARRLAADAGSVVLTVRQVAEHRLVDIVLCCCIFVIYFNLHVHL